MSSINLIREENKKKRVEWAEKLTDWEFEDFSEIYFRNESLMCCEK